MTKNQTIDGVLVSRELLQRWLDDIGPSRHVTQHSALKRDELRALLDAPALELIEPVAPWFYFVECDDPDYSGLFNHENEAQTQANDHGGEVVRLWNVPPTWRPAPDQQPVSWLDPDCGRTSKTRSGRYYVPLYLQPPEQPAPAAEDERANKQRELKLILSDRLQNAEDNCSAYRHKIEALQRRVDVQVGMLREVVHICSLTASDHEPTADTLELHDRIEAELKQAEGNDDEALLKPPVAADERERTINEISEAINRMPYTRKHLAECLYDSGYRKQVAR